MAPSSHKPGPPSHAAGMWMPKNRSEIRDYLNKRLEKLDTRDEAELDPSVLALKELVENSSYLRRLSEDMFIEIPPVYHDDPAGAQQVRDFETALRLVNMMIKEGPQWAGKNVIPINSIFDWPMGTDAGYHFFIHDEVNEKIRDILNTWAKYLSSEDSLECLDPKNGGWLAPDSLEKLAEKGNHHQTNYSFEQLYICDPKDPFYGFKSWDDFFTRQFRPGIREVEAPDDQPAKPGQPAPTRVIANPCESAPLQWAQGVKLHDTFWAKHQPYSLYNMLGRDDRAEKFVGGSVYQAFLNAWSYHRWHAPVSGKVESIKIVPGTYYSENIFHGFMSEDDHKNPDSEAPKHSQPYIANTATRGVMFVQADDDAIGLMAVIFIGMGDVSSCDFTIKTGDQITKGQEIGMFHFGGSSVAMVFGPKTKLQFVNPPPWDVDAGINNPVKSALAIAQ